MSEPINTVLTDKQLSYLWTIQIIKLNIERLKQLLKSSLVTSQLKNYESYLNEAYKLFSEDVFNNNFKPKITNLGMYENINLTEKEIELLEEVLYCRDNFVTLSLNDADTPYDEKKVINSYIAFMEVFAKRFDKHNL